MSVSNVVAVTGGRENGVEPAALFQNILVALLSLLTVEGNEG
jgi:hypothetical protein